MTLLRSNGEDPSAIVNGYPWPKRVSKRFRVNVSISTKGQKTWECTTDCEGMSMEEVVAESDRLVALLEARYAVPVG